VLGGLVPTLFGRSLGGPISEVTDQKVSDQTHTFTKIYVFRMEGFGGRPGIVVKFTCMVRPNMIL